MTNAESSAPASSVDPRLDEGRGSVLARWGWLIVTGAAVLPYLGVLNAPFVFDDVKLVKDNELLRVDLAEAPSRFVEVFAVTSDRFAEEEVRLNYRPLRFASYYLDYQLSRWLLGEFPPDDPPPFFFHLQNLLWHLANALLVLAIGRRLLGSAAGAFLLALIFALHPLQTEAVTYVSGRRDVLSTFFFLAAIALYVSVEDDRKLGPTVLRYAPIPFLFAAGFLTKEMVITLPAVLLLLDLSRRSRPRLARLVLHGSLWILTAAFVGITLSTEGLVAESGGRNWFLTAFTAARYAARYLGLTLFPVSQSIDYSFDSIPATRGLLDPWTTPFCVVLVAGLAGVAGWACLRRQPVLAVGLGWFLVSLLPVLQIVPTAERFAERFAYLPSIGVFLIVSSAALRLRRFEPRLMWVAVASVAVLLGGGTVLRNMDWTSPLRLWQAAVEAQPRCARAHLAYGIALERQGRLEEARDSFSRALEIWAESRDPSPLQHGHVLRARTWRGELLLALGKREKRFLEEAKTDFEWLLAARDVDGAPIESSPQHAILHWWLGECYRLTGEPEAAEREYERLIAVSPRPDGAALGWYGKAKLRFASDDLAAALDRWRRAVAGLPKGDARRLFWRLELVDGLLTRRERLDEAWTLLEGALRDSTTAEEKAGVLLRQARVLDLQGEIHGAAQRLEEALAVDFESRAVRETLADLRVRLGDDAGAARLYRELIERDPGNQLARDGLLKIQMRARVASNGDESSGNRKFLAGLLAKGRQHVDQGQLTAALEVFSELATRAQTAEDRRMGATAYVEVAGVQDKLKQFSKAADALNDALRLQPDMPEALLAAADLFLRRLNRRDRARTYYERYLGALPAGVEPEPRVHVNLGYLLKRERPEQALEHFLSAKRLGPEKALGQNAHVLEREIGYLFARLGRWLEARDALTRYLTTAPFGDPGRKETLEFIQDEVIPHLVPEPESK